MDSIFEYDISIQWQISIVDVLTELIVEDIIIDYNTNMSHFIVQDYFGAGEAFITIQIDSAQTTESPNEIFTSQSNKTIITTINNNGNNKNADDNTVFLTVITILVSLVIMFLLIICIVLVKVRSFIILYKNLMFKPKKQKKNKKNRKRNKMRKTSMTSLHRK